MYFNGELHRNITVKFPGNLFASEIHSYFTDRFLTNNVDYYDRTSHSSDEHLYSFSLISFNFIF